MWNLYGRLTIRVTDAEKYGFDPAKTYTVVGTCERWSSGEDGKRKCQDMLLAVNDKGEITQVFPMKCKAAPAAVLTADHKAFFVALRGYVAGQKSPDQDLVALAESAGRFL